MVGRIQSRFLVRPETFPPALAVAMRSGIAPKQEIEHGFTPAKTRLTQRTLEAGAVVFEERPYDASPIGDSFWYQDLIAEIRSHRRMSPDEFAEAWPDTEGQRLSKTRYPVTIPDGPLVDVDVYKSRPDMPAELDVDGRMLAVVHFATLKEAQAFVSPDFDNRPDWLGNNVTNVVSSRKLAKGKTWWLEDSASIHDL